MSAWTTHAALALTLLTVGACQTAPQADSGFIAGYDRLEVRKKTLRAAVRERRDDAPPSR